MKIKEVLSFEKGNISHVFLVKEGMFWRVYNRSAFLFTKHVKALKLTKKFYKIVGRNMVYGGFPDTILLKVLEKAGGMFKILEQEERMMKLVLRGESENIKETIYSEWFEEIEELYPQEKQYTCKDLVEDIKSFSILESTPIESQLFLVQLQKQVHGFI